MWQKKNTNSFAVAMRAYDGAEICELIGLCLALSNKQENPFSATRTLCGKRKTPNFLL